MTCEQAFNLYWALFISGVEQTGDAAFIEFAEQQKQSTLDSFRAGWNASRLQEGWDDLFSGHASPQPKGE